MKKLVMLLTAVAALALVPTINASITNAYWYADGDGAIVCPQGWTNSGPSVSSISMYGDQFGLPGQPYAAAHMFGTVQLDSDEDPTLTLNGTVENNTGNSWYGYQINVIMSIPFTFGPPGPSVTVPPNYDWSVSQVDAPAWNGSAYVGTLWFAEGTSILNGGTLDFLYSINFSGTWGFSFTQEMIPWATQVPEPSTAVLGGLGALLVGYRLRRNRQA